MVSRDCLELVCGHLDIDDVLRLAAVNNTMRATLEQSQLHFKESVSMQNSAIPRILQGATYDHLIIKTPYIVCSVACCPTSSAIACGT